eukprot:XP_001699387.1 predicted protein [Chlamydomonas reinhardtii]
MATLQVGRLRGLQRLVLRGGEGSAGESASSPPAAPPPASATPDLRAWVSASPADWPDALFLLNTADTSLDEDVLVPITVGMHRWRPLAYFPWRSKLDVAAWRGREYCHTRPTGYTGDTCSRTYLAGLSAFSEEWGRLVDVGFVDNYTARGAEGQPLVIPARGFVPTQELARFRYVLALDGITASSRLARLLSLNSVVVKQTSPWIEWYYRSLVPGTHYVTFWNHHRTDLLNTLRYIRHKSRYLLDVSVHGQRAVSGYVGLFGDMESYMAGLAHRMPAASSFQSVLQECAYVQQTIDSLGPVPQAISESWGEAWAQRVEQATSQPLLLQLDDGESCEVVVVGVNHRDPSNLAFILEIAQATQPDAVALEARAGFLDTYRQLTAAVPPQLLERVAWMPLTGGLQALLGGGPRDLALSDKVAAIVVANELDVPLHGLELDDPLAYAALLAGPLGGGVAGAS